MDFTGLISGYGESRIPKRSVVEGVKRGVIYLRANPNHEDPEVSLELMSAAKKAVKGEKMPFPWLKRAASWWSEHPTADQPSDPNYVAGLLYGGAEGKSWYAEQVTKKEQGNSGDIRYKQVASTIKDVDYKNGTTPGRVIGYSSVKNVEDSDREIIRDGAFELSINSWGPDGKDRIKKLYQHNPTFLIGRFDVLKEDSYGLYEEALVSRTAMGNDVLRLLADGVLTEQSIGFMVMESEPDIDSDIWYLDNLKLYESSYVTWGANDMTRIDQVAVNGKLEDVAQAIQQLTTGASKALRDGVWDSDEVPEMLELTAMKITAIAKSIQRQVAEFTGGESVASIVKELEPHLGNTNPDLTRAATPDKTDTDGNAPSAPVDSIESPLSGRKLESSSEYDNEAIGEITTSLKSIVGKLEGLGLTAPAPTDSSTPDTDTPDDEELFAAKSELERIVAKATSLLEPDDEPAEAEPDISEIFSKLSGLFD